MYKQKWVFVRFEVGMWYNQTCMFRSSTLEKDKPVRMHSISGKRSGNRDGGKSLTTLKASDGIWRLRWKVLGSDEEIGVGTEGGGTECHEWNANFWLEQFWDESGEDRKRSRDSCLALLANCTTQKMKFQTLLCYSRAGHCPWPEIKVDFTLLPGSICSSIVSQDFIISVKYITKIEAHIL